MLVLVKTKYGSWQYVKQSSIGYVFGIYKTNALEGVDNLNKCKSEFPQLEFKLGD